MQGRGRSAGFSGRGLSQDLAASPRPSAWPSGMRPAIHRVGGDRQTAAPCGRSVRLRRSRGRARNGPCSAGQRPARDRPRQSEPDRRRLDPRRAGARARRRRLAGGAGGRLPRCWRRSRTRRGRGASRGARGAARRQRRARSPRPGWRAAATPRSTPPAATILLFADDDIVHPPGAYAGIRRFFAENPGLDLFVGRSLDPDGRPRKRPLPRRRLTRLNAARASSHEIARPPRPGARRRRPLRRGLRRRRRHRRPRSARSTSSSPTAWPPGSRACTTPCRSACTRTRARASSGMARRRPARARWSSPGSSAAPRRRCGSPSR